jgi:F420H(2)-dependent quinone reductase
VKGRKTGKLRTIPLIYIRDADRFVIAAAYAGSEQNPTWWLNLQSSGEGLVQVMRDTVRVRAQVAPPEARAELWQRLSVMYPYFTDYQTRTSREIPIVILSPILEAAV